VQKLISAHLARNNVSYQFDPDPNLPLIPIIRDQIKQVAGYDDRFCRMWEFYLAGCESAFRYMNQMVFQIQIARRQDAVPLTRNYVIDAENGVKVTRSMAAE
jgi:cyclopropane-fatty-acyl-phospholipid synthase